MADPPDCVTLTLGNQGAQVRLPGGAALSVMVPDLNPSDLAITKSLLAQGNAALAPLLPVFNIIDALLAVKDFAEAVPGLLTDPTALVDAIAALIEKITKLAELIPQLSVPFLVVDLIDVGITALNGFVTELNKIVQQELNIAAAITKANTAPLNPSLLDVTTCASDLVAQTKQGLEEGLGPLNTFFGLLSIFLGLIGQPPIPDVSDLGDDAAAAISTLEDTVKLLQDIRAAIPLP